jgi:IMP dehydrogenase
MNAHNTKIIGEGLTYDDVLLVPNFSNVLPREVNIQSNFSRNITLNVPVVSAAMDTVTEAKLAIAIAQQGGIGVIHKNMSIEMQAMNVRKVKRSESGMIIDPITVLENALVKDALDLMKENSIGGIPVVDENKILKGSVTNRDLRFEKNIDRPIREIMTSENIITTGDDTIHPIGNFLSKTQEGISDDSIQASDYVVEFTITYDENVTGGTANGASRVIQPVKISCGLSKRTPT